MQSKIIEFNEVLDISPEYFYEELPVIVSLHDERFSFVIKPQYDPTGRKYLTRKFVYILFQGETFALFMVSHRNANQIEVMIFRIANENIEDPFSIRKVQDLAWSILTLDPKTRPVEKRIFQAFSRSWQIAVTPKPNISDTQNGNNVPPADIDTQFRMEKVAKAYELKKEGLSWGMVAAQLDMSERTLRDWRKKFH